MKKHLQRASIFVVLAFVFSFAAFQPTVTAAPSNINLDSFGLNVDEIATVDGSGQQSGAGVFGNGRVEGYPEGACLPSFLTLSHSEEGNADVEVEIDYDYYDNSLEIVGIADLENITPNFDETEVGSVDDLSDFTYELTGLSSGTSLIEGGGTVTTEVTGPTQSGNGRFISRTYTVVFEDVPTDTDVYYFFCARLGLDAGQFSGASMSVNMGSGGGQTTPINADDLLLLPSITITKVVDSGDALPEDFSFSVSPAVNGETEFSIPSESTSVTIENVSPNGNYTVTENGAEGYVFLSGTGTNCSFDGETATASVEAGSAPTNASCTFTNTALPTLTVEKVVVNNDSGEAVVADFVLYVDETTVVSGEANSFEPGTYTVSEDNLEGYTSTFSGDCDESGSVTLAYGNALTCTITNDDDVVVAEPVASLTVVKVVNNDAGGEAAVGDFTLYVDATEVLSDETNEFTPGDYTVSEDNLENYEAAFSGDCGANGDISMEDAGEYTCTITNTYVAPEPETAELTITKVVVGGEASELYYSFEATEDVEDGEVYEFPESGDSQDLPLGTYVVTEIGPTEDYTASFSGDCNTDGEVVLDEADASYECVITNTYEGDEDDGPGPGPDIDPPTVSSITVVKIVVNDDGGEAEVGDFTLYVDETVVVSGAETAFSAGNYVVSEDGLEGYVASFSGDCDASGNIELEEGEELTCTITNNDIAEEEEEEEVETTLLVITLVDNDDGGDLEPWETENLFTDDAESETTFAGDNDGVRFTLSAGTFEVEQTSSASRYVITYSGDCSGTIDEGESLTCTITNTYERRRSGGGGGGGGSSTPPPTSLPESDPEPEDTGDSEELPPPTGQVLGFTDEIDTNDLGIGAEGLTIEELPRTGGSSFPLLWIIGPLAYFLVPLTKKKN